MVRVEAWVRSLGLQQRPPTFWAPEISFVEDNFSTDQGEGGDGFGGDSSTFHSRSPPAVQPGS